jgi:hypothetical protein
VDLQPAAFLREFVLPLVAGGELHVGRPLDADDVERLRAETVIETSESEAVHHARQTLAADLWLYPVPTPLDDSALALCVGLHNLLFLSHPVAGRWWLRDRQLERLESFTARCLRQVPPPDTPEQLVARHSLLWCVPRLMRHDVEVRFWAGRRTYEGMAPPRRLMRWRQLRGVREQIHEVLWAGTEISDTQRELLDVLMSRSPLTDLLTPDRQAPAFDWQRVAPWLQRPALCRLVAHRYLEMGLTRVGPPLARAFWQLVDRHAPAEEDERRLALLLAAGLVVYLYATTTLVTAKEEQLEVDPSDPTGALAAVLMAASRCGLIPSSAVLGDEELVLRLQRWAQAPAARLGPAAEQLTENLRAALAA